MIACDVTILVYAHNGDEPRHGDYRQWLEHAADGDQPLGLSSLVASGFLRVVTHPKVLARPRATDVALEVLAELRAASAVVSMEPRRRH